MCCYLYTWTRGVCLPWPDSPDTIRIGVRTRGGGRMRLSEFLKYLILLLVLAIVLVAISHR